VSWKNLALAGVLLPSSGSYLATQGLRGFDIEASVQRWNAAHLLTHEPNIYLYRTLLYKKPLGVTMQKLSV